MGRPYTILIYLAPIIPMLQLLLTLFISIFQPALQPAEIGLYMLQDGTPVQVSNFVMPTAGCEWSGVGGQVFNHTDSPVEGLLIQVKGTLEGVPIQQYAVTGSSLQFGQGGYEMMLSDHLVAGSLSVRLLDLAGQPLSAPIPLVLTPDCQKNLVIINLVEMLTPYS